MQNKEWTLKMGRETHQTAYKGRTIRITSNVPMETLKIWKAWKDILQILKEKNHQPTLQNSEKYCHN